MKFKFSGPDASDFNDRTEHLLTLVGPPKGKAEDCKSLFHPNYLKPVASLNNSELPSLPLQSTIGIDGCEVERFFTHGGQPWGFAGDGYRIFSELSQALKSVTDLENKISLTYAADALFHWVEQRFVGARHESFVDYLEKRVDRDVHDLEIWIPLTGITTDVEINLISGTITSAPRKEYDSSERAWHIAKPGRFQQITRFLAETHVTPITVFRTHLEAEQILAVEVAHQRATESLELLRFFSPANFEPGMFSHCSVFGTEYVSRPSYLLIRAGLIISSGSTDVNIRWQHPWRISKKLKDEFDKNGLNTLVSIAKLDAETRSDLQHTIMRCIKLYSKVSLSQELGEKLLYAVVSLESLLLKNGSEPLQKNISERMALLIGRSLAERRSIIRDYKVGYKLRSALVHHGKEVPDAQLVRPFLRNTWYTLSQIIQWHENFLTTEELINHIDEMKFS
jgi:hypothetical protein